MRRILAACAGALAITGALVPNASAAQVNHADCWADATWSVTLTTATVTYTNMNCYDTQAAANLGQFLPEWSASGTHNTNPGPVSRTFAYSPIVGLCDGQLAYTDSTVSITGLLKNDGNYHTAVTMVMTLNSGLLRAVEIDAAALQNACSPSFATTSVEFVFGAVT